MDDTYFYLFQIQRYEGASTIYGPYTLDAYLQEFERLAAALAKVLERNVASRP